MGNLTNEIKKFVEEECKKPGAHYGYECFLCHFVPMVEHAKNLAKEFDSVDIEAVELAAWLHDIGSIMKGRVDHHITGAEIAEKKLRELGCSEERLQKIKSCILSHRGSQNIARESVEAQIIADADAISAFDNLSGLFKAAIFCEGLTSINARESVRDKLINSWNKLSPKVRKSIQNKYSAAMMLLN